MAKAAPKTKTRQKKGTGSVYQTGTGSWVAQVDLGRDEKGKRKKKAFERKTQGEAIKAATEFSAKMALGIPVETSKQTVGEFLTAWLTDTIEPHTEPKTYRVYEQISRLYLKPKLGHFKLAKLGSQHVQAALNQLSISGARPDKVGNPVGLAPKTVRDIKGVLCSALNSAKAANLLSANPAENAKTPKLGQREAVYLSASEAASLIATSEDHYLGPLIHVALMTGLRLGEAIGLTWDNVDFYLGVIRVRQQLQRVKGVDKLKGLKTKASNRTLALPDEGLEALKTQQGRQEVMRKEWKAREPFNPVNLVFTSVRGKPLEGGQVDDALKALCVVAKVTPISFHKLRHTAATHMAAAGVPLSVVKDQLGHSTLAMTSDTYSHAVPAAMRQASDALGTVLRSARTNTADEEVKTVG